MHFIIPAIAAGEVSNAFAVLMGIGTVFVGLICIILLIQLMSVILSKFPEKEDTAPQPAAAASAAAQDNDTAIENRSELVAAICAAVAEECGTDISALRVVSFKKL